jgi:hypothetical protein
MRGSFDLPSRSCDNLVLESRSCAASSVTTWSWFVTWENWRLVVAKSVMAVPRPRSSSDTLASSTAFSRAATWAASRAAVLVAAATVLALSAASSADAAAARSFSISTSGSASLDASKSRSVAAAAAAVSVVVARSSVDWQAASRDDRADTSLATAPAVVTQATTNYISCWVRSAWSSCSSRACLRPNDSRVCRR